MVTDCGSRYECKPTVAAFFMHRHAHLLSTSAWSGRQSQNMHGLISCWKRWNANEKPDSLYARRLLQSVGLHLRLIQFSIWLAWSTPTGLMDILGQSRLNRSILRPPTVYICCPLIPNVQLLYRFGRYAPFRKFTGYGRGSGQRAYIAYRRPLLTANSKKFVFREPSSYRTWANHLALGPTARFRSRDVGLLERHRVTE